jgi:hypothetical protein
MRFSANTLPLHAPCRRTASKAYAEQLGVKRHWLSGPNKNVFAGEITQRYTRTPKTKMCCAKFTFHRASSTIPLS